MKTKSITIVSCLLLVGLLNTSCNSCNDKTRNSSTDQTTDAIAPGMNDAASGDAEITTAEELEYNSAADQSTSTTTKTTTTKKSSATTSTSTSGKKPARTTTGYSAPNGTDAENNDGDYYTRNDTVSMPTGPPIK